MGRSLRRGRFNSASFDTARQEIRDAPQTTHQIAKLLTDLAEEEMVMLSCCTFIVRLRARKLDVPRLAFLDQLH